MADYNFEVVSSELMEQMKLMRLSDELRDFIVTERKSWPVFGKKNSHLYRAELVEAFSKAGLSPEAKSMVYFFSAVIKNKDRVIKAMDNMKEDTKMKTWFSPTRDFFATKVAQYVTQAQRQQKFPMVNIPSTNPGLDILLWCYYTEDKNRTLENLKDRTTFSQLKLNDEMQALAKEGYRKYWDKTVKGTRNPDAKVDNLPAPMMREEYYANPASDEYPLINKDLTTKTLSTNESGYTRKEILDYLRSFDATPVSS